MPLRSTSVFDPTGSPLATCASTTRRRTSCCLGVSCSFTLICSNFSDGSGDQFGGDPAAQEAAALGERERGLVVACEAELFDAREAGGIECVRDARERDRLVETQAEHDPLARVNDLVEHFDLAVVFAGEIAPELRCVPPALVAQRRDRPDADAEIVAAEPV